MPAGYAGFTGEQRATPRSCTPAKLQIMREELAAEVERLTGLLADVCERHRRHATTPAASCATRCAR